MGVRVLLSICSFLGLMWIVIVDVIIVATKTRSRCRGWRGCVGCVLQRARNENADKKLLSLGHDKRVPSGAKVS